MLIKKIPNSRGLVTKPVFTTKISDVESKIPDHAKFITSQEFIKLAAESLATRLKQANSLRNTDFDNKLISFNRKITLNKTKYLEVQKKAK